MSTYNQIRSAPVVTTVTPPLADGKRRQITVRRNPRTLAFDADVTVAAPKNYDWARDWARRKGLSKDEAEEFMRGLERADRRKRLNGASDNNVETIHPSDPRVVGATEYVSPDADPISRELLGLRAYLEKHMGGGDAGRVALSKIDNLLHTDARKFTKQWLVQYAQAEADAEDGGTQLQTITVGDSALQRLDRMLQQPNATNASIARVDKLLREPEHKQRDTLARLNRHLGKIGIV